ncbi:MAG: DUF1684 domain-containing protein [Alphaproteobacteria bacterium]
MTGPDRPAAQRALDHYGQVWDWRRQMQALYETVRRSQDPVQAWCHWRDSRDRLFAGHPQSPLSPAQRRHFSGLSYFDYDPEMRFSVGLIPAPDAAAEVQDLGGGHSLRLIPFARTCGLSPKLEREGLLYWLDGYAGGCFFAFRDDTSGGETHSDGRFLLDTIKSADLGEADGQLIVDFNFAHHASCAYQDNPDWICPVAPAANHFPPAIRAGERFPRSGG